MLFSRQSHITRAVALLALAGQATLFSACADGGRGPTSAVPAPSAQDGAAIFRGIYFGEGDVGRALPEIWNGKGAQLRSPTPEHAAQVVQLEDHIVAKISQEDAGFFQGFAEAMRSGDHFAVEAALVEGGKRLKRAAQIGELEENYVARGLWLYTDVAVAAVVVVLAFLVISQIDATPNVEITDQPEITGASTLKREFIVDLIASRMAAPAS